MAPLNGRQADSRFQAKPQASTSDADEDDYMNMTFEEPAPEAETSIQRSERRKRESQARGIVKSKATLEQEAKAAREEALSKSMLDDPRSKNSKGLAMMSKMGFAGGTLGKKTQDGQAGDGIAEPIQVKVRDGRAGIGLETEKKRQLDEETERAVKAPRIDPLEYRDRVIKEKREARLESQLVGAQRVAERLEESAFATSRFTALPVIYRGLVRAREQSKEGIRIRHQLENSLGRLPVLADDGMDEHDKMALGLEIEYAASMEDFEVPDKELEEFNALSAAERLRRAVEYLRDKHNYCFWCKMAYPDEDMEGCPGMTEEDHD